jgi:hypothetical protein
MSTGLFFFFKSRQQQSVRLHAFRRRPLSPTQPQDAQATFTACEGTPIERGRTDPSPSTFGHGSVVVVAR